MTKEKIIKALKWFYRSYIWVGLLFLIVDIISKNIIANTMTEGDSIELIPNFLSITYTINRHAAFGIGPENPTISKVLYITVAVIASVGIPIYYVKNKDKLPWYVRIALTMIVAGALGNMIDRIFYTAEYLHALPGEEPGVVDFIDFFKGSKLHNLWHYIFNVADCGVVIGVFILIIRLIIEEVEDHKKQKKAKPAKTEDNEKVLSVSEKKKLEEQDKNRVN